MHHFLRYLNVGNWSSSEDSELSDCDDCVSSSGSRRNDFLKFQNIKKSKLNHIGYAFFNGYSALFNILKVHKLTNISKYRNVTQPAPLKVKLMLVTSLLSPTIFLQQKSFISTIVVFLWIKSAKEFLTRDQNLCFVLN